MKVENLRGDVVVHTILSRMFFLSEIKGWVSYVGLGLAYLTTPSLD